MAVDLPKAFEPAGVEARWYPFWKERGLFRANPASRKKPFGIVIPPPNVTGALHMGHALNTTLQDVLARYKRMDGFEVLWLPGTDHAGIATQNVVEKELKREGIDRHAIGREAFIEKVWAWKKQSGDRILHQLERLGASCDWSRLRFTMDEGLSDAVREVFIRLYEEGWIYRGERLINWCPRCRTALSDLEVEHQEVKGSLWYVRYPLPPGDGEFVVVATTRPETILGDTAVAVHPKDAHYMQAVGRTVTLPFLNREIPVLADRVVDTTFGTGAVKVTPAHDFNDFEIGNRHHLPRINIFTPEGKINGNGGPYAGLDRFACREKIVEDLKAAGLLEKIEEHLLSVGHCYRCHTIVEPYLSLQWFVRVGPMAKAAAAAVRTRKTRFVPKGWEKTYFAWLKEIKDWCISRQIWWGHRIPAWYCEGDKDKCCQLACREPVVGVKQPTRCRHCSSGNFRQEEDVLDTWFSSALWPFSTLGWPRKTPELKKFYPTSVLVTGFDIIFFWVARMMMMGLKFMKKVPFREVYIHALVRDIEGKKMSKSKGNVIDPVEVMDQYGTDAFRFTLAALAAQGRDIRLAPERIEGYRNFCNKIWNAARFVLAQGGDGAKGKEVGELSLADRWILGRLHTTIRDVRASIDCYEFDRAAHHLYQFFWHEYCDWYLELSKISPNLKVLKDVLATSLKLLHPFMPFITEELWGHVSEGKGSILAMRYPRVSGKPPYAREVKEMERVMEVVAALRNIRGENRIPLDARIPVIIRTRSEALLNEIRRHAHYIAPLVRAQGFSMATDGSRPVKSAAAVVGPYELFVPLEGLIDIHAEADRLTKEIGRVREEIVAVRTRLENQSFITKAPPSVVAAEKERLRAQELKVRKLEEALAALH